MSSKFERMQRIIRSYKDETGKRAADMHAVAKYAAQKGWPLPAPRSAIDLLAREFSRAARQETRKDKETGLPYRANQSFSEKQGDKQLPYGLIPTRRPATKCSKRQ